MATSTNLISGLASGFDWRSMIDQVIAIERKPVDLMENKKEGYEEQRAEWQSVNTMLLSLKTAASSLKDGEDFFVHTANMSSNNSTVDASNLLSVNTSSTASPGSYTLTIDQLATAQKLSSQAFSSFEEALGASYAGDILINGKVISINATDSLADIKDRINNANSGSNPTAVTASIVRYAENDYRLILTSDHTGEDGIGLLNGSSLNLVELFGWKDGVSSLKNSITGGAQSDRFGSTSQNLKTLLGLTTTQAGTIQIEGQNIALDLSTDSLEDIKTNINNAGIPGVTASIITDTSGTTTKYRLQIDGSQSFVDDQNMLETLGVLHDGVTDVQGTSSENSMTANGATITASTALASIDGYLGWTSGDSITISGTDHSNNTVGDSFTITASSTVQDLLDAIETAFETNGYDVTATVTAEGTIQVADMETGASSLSLSLTSTVSNGALDWGAFSALDTVRKRELIAGQDASLFIDGVSVTSEDNTVEDVLPGVTLNLLQADEDTTVTLNVVRDIEAIMENISAFVEAYNEVSAYIGEQQSYDQEEEEAGGILFGDGTLSSIKADLSSLLVEPVWGVSSEFSILGLVGINLNNEGQLEVDTDELEGFLRTNFNDIKGLFASNGAASSGAIEYISHDRRTQAGEYELNITQAATQSTATSDRTVSGTLGFDERLSITQGGSTAVVSLTSGMTIYDIINSVNTELDTVYTESIAGDAALLEGGAAATAATTWANVDGANIVDGDIISFSGADRNGFSVSGSYAIADVTSDTIQGLLSDIESAFANKVSASLDGSGHVIITDLYTGTSQLSISFDYSQTANQVDMFGSLSTSNSGGQEGRYAMEITASNDGSDHLVLTHDHHGSEFSFTVEEDTDTGLWTGSLTTPVEVNNGQDVAGTINGEAATGKGQILTGDEGAAGVEGLMVKYTGTDTGLAGSVTLTLGVAERFDRALYNITDSVDGYLSFKLDSLKNSIEDYATRIEESEARLEMKIESMINQFVAMEIAIAEIQSQSQWLTSQINSFYA